MRGRGGRRSTSKSRMATDPDRVRAELLGTGTSTGIPVIGCSCRVCRSDDPRDQRLRCSCHVEAAGVHLQIDTGPDFREQALRAGLRSIDAVLYTHHHFDHVAGIDDLRPFLFETRKPIPCYALPETAAVMRSMYGYIFQDGSYPGVPRLELHELHGPLRIASRTDPARSVLVEPLHVSHGSMTVAAFRIGRFAYVTDTNAIPVETERRLRGLDVLVLDALRATPHRAHFSIPEAVETARRLGPQRTVFVHMTHSVLHADASSALPDGMTLGFDGQVLETGFD